MLLLQRRVIRQWRISVFMVIIETSFFTRRITALMSDDEYRALQQALIIQQNTGAIIQGTGGLRKVRWRLDGRGKSTIENCRFRSRARASSLAWLATGSFPLKV